MIKISTFNNALFRIMSFVIMVIGGFIVAPITLFKLGKVDYGIWIFITSLASYSSIFFLGFGTVIVKEIVSYKINLDKVHLNKILGTVQGIYCAVSLIIFFVFVVFTIGLPFLIKLPGAHFSYQMAVLIIGLQFALSFPLCIYSAILTGTENFIIRDLNMLFGILIQYIAIFVVPKEYATVVFFAILSIVVQLASSFANYIFSRIVLPEAEVKIKNYNFQAVSSLFKISIPSFFISVAQKIIELTDIIIIGIFLGPVAVAMYSVPQKLVQYLHMLLAQAQGVLFPSFFKYNLEQKKEELAQVYINAFRYSLVIVIPIMIIYCVYGGVFISLWMGPDFAEVHYILIILCMPYFLYQPIIATFLNSSEHRPLVAKISLLQAFFNLVMSLLLIHKWKLLGIAIATSTPCLLIGGIWLSYLLLRSINVSIKDFLWKTCFPFLLAFVVSLSLAYFFYCQNYGKNLCTFLIICCIVQVTFIIFFIPFDSKLKAIIFLQVPKIWHRLFGCKHDTR